MSTVTPKQIPFTTLSWIFNKNFDFWFIFGIAAFALTIGQITLNNPSLLTPIVNANILLLGMTHVIATYTRISFSLGDFKQNKFYILALPIIVIVIVSLIANINNGLAIVATAYLYWQWWHYTRQSYGISRSYLAKDKMIAVPHAWINSAALYLLPLTGILYRSYQSPETFLSLPIYTLPVGLNIVIAVGILAIVAIIAQVVLWVSQHKQGKLPKTYVLYMLSHYTIFSIGYMLIDNITIGWLVLNIWHNSQYNIFVWMNNNKRFSSVASGEESFISKISQKENIITYVSYIIAITWVFYGLIQYASKVGSIYFIFPIYIAINFHHYIIDMFIWKRKKKS